MEHYSEERLTVERTEYTEERRSRRDLWGEGSERDLEHRRYREDSRPPQASQAIKGGREWGGEEYVEHEWDSRGRRGGAPMDWEGSRENWDSRGEQEHSHIEEDWRHYNRSMDSWSTDDRRRWAESGGSWREREHSRPRSSTSHRDGKRFFYNTLVNYVEKSKCI